MIQAKFGLNWPHGFRGEDILKSLQTDDGRQVMAIAHTTTGRGKIWVVLLHHYIHAYKIICFINT
jgi:hypothetical protein